MHGAGGMAAGAEGLESSLTIMVELPFGHYAAARVSCAENKDIFHQLQHPVFFSEGPQQPACPLVSETQQAASDAAAENICASCIV